MANQQHYFVHMINALNLWGILYPLADSNSPLKMAYASLECKNPCATLQPMEILIHSTKTDI